MITPTPAKTNIVATNGAPREQKKEEKTPLQSPPRSFTGILQLACRLYFEGPIQNYEPSLISISRGPELLLNVPPSTTPPSIKSISCLLVLVLIKKTFYYQTNHHNKVDFVK